jgi:two-component system cell cycle sensor histidine kinase/response regulator CckA
VLIAEDEEAVRSLTTRILKQAGYSVLAARSGDEALRVSELHPGSIDLLLTDVVMPGMFGNELAERLAKLRPNLQVLYMSGYIDTSFAQAPQTEPIAFLPKPFSQEELLMQVRDLLDTRAGDPGSGDT